MKAQIINSNEHWNGPVPMLRLLVLSLCVAALYAHAQPTITNTAIGTAFRYQGVLRGFFQSPFSPDSGPVQFRFGLWSDPAATNLEFQVSSNIITTLNVSNNFFSTMLDFGDVFDGRRLFLDVAVWANTNIFLPTNWVTVSPRTEIGPVPYAMWAEKGGAIILRTIDGNNLSSMYYIQGGKVQFEDVSIPKVVDNIRVSARWAFSSAKEDPITDEIIYPSCPSCSALYHVEVWKRTNSVSSDDAFSYSDDEVLMFERNLTSSISLAVNNALTAGWVSLQITNPVRTLNPDEVLYLVSQADHYENTGPTQIGITAEAVVHDSVSTNTYGPQ